MKNNGTGGPVFFASLLAAAFCLLVAQFFKAVKEYKEEMNKDVGRKDEAD